MKKSNIYTIKSEASGQFILPQHLVEQLCLVDGEKIRIEVTESGMFLSSSTSGLRKIYVEVTNGCNLGCRTCMRNAWNEPLGRMTWETYASIIDGDSSFSPAPLLFFGGFGEPLSHPDLSKMIATAVNEGINVELITNGTLLTETLIRQFINFGVQRIWVSIDGASRESYTDIRLGDSLPLVLNNLSLLQKLLIESNQSLPKIGIAFVAMRRNIQDLPEVIR